jgi:hypothetical protein
MRVAFAVVLLAGCVKPTQATSDASASTTAPAPVASAKAITATPKSEGGAPRPLPGMQGLLLAWNAAINAHDADKLGALYADEVDLYGTPVSRAKAVALKKEAFAGHVRDEISRVTVDGPGRVTFRKRSLLKSGKRVDVSAYLEASDGRITIEGDTTTDANLARAKDRACSDAVQNLVDQTAEAKHATQQIEKAAETSPVPVGVGGFATPPESPGDTWHVSICENYADRMPCYHYFEVDPATAVVVYSYGGLDPRPIKTDPALAAKVRAVCP